MTPYKMPGRGDGRAAPYSKLFTNPGATDLTTQIPQANNSSSGALVIATAAASAISYTDSAGNVVALTGLAAGTYDFYGVSWSAINSSTTCLVVVYWHGVAGS